MNLARWEVFPQANNPPGVPVPSVASVRRHTTSVKTKVQTARRHNVLRMSARTISLGRDKGHENRMQSLNGKLETENPCEGDPIDARMPLSP